VSFPRKESFENIYDGILPNEANKFFNKKTWGYAKVGEAEIPTGERKTFNNIGAKEATKWIKRYQKEHGLSELENIDPKLLDEFIYQHLGEERRSVWSLPITDKMQAKAMGEGMPQYQVEAFQGGPHDVTKSPESHKRYQIADTPEQQAFIDKGGFGDRPKETIRQKYDAAKVRVGAKFRQGMVDQYDSFTRILKDKQAWMMAHLTKSHTGVLMAAINTGTPFLDSSGAVGVRENTKGLHEIFKTLGAGDEIKRFLAHISAHRAARLKRENRENLFSDAQITAGKTLDQGAMADGRNRQQVYTQVRREFENLGDAVVNIGVKTGLINKAEAAKWKIEGWYVPFYRMLEDSGAKGPANIGSLTGQQAYKRLKGGKSQIEDPLTNVLMNWDHIISAGLRNQAGTRALRAAVRMGIAREVMKKAKSKDAVYIRQNGKERWFEINDDLDGSLVLDSLLSLNYEGMNTRAIKVFRSFKRALTIGVTASPGFKIRNLLRDTIHAAAVTTASPWMLSNVFTGFRTGTTQMEVGGGAFGESGYIHGSDPDAIKRMVASGIDESTILNTKNKFAKIWKAYQDFGARLENVNRVAGYERDLAAGKTLLEANFNARDQLDFARTGSFSAIRFIAQTVPFLNARLQGLDKMYRSAGMTREWRDSKQQRQFFAVTSTYALAATLLYLAMKDDDDFKESEDWEKRTYHLFKIPGSDKMYRIPRPFEVGAIAYMAERMTEQFVDQNAKIKDLKSEVIHTLADTFSFNPIPQAVKPIIEVYANKNMFTGRNIESLGMQYLTKPERFQPWTSETAKGASRVMSAITPETVTLSPVQIQHMVRAYTGWLGSSILAGTDGIVKMGIGGAKPPKKNWFEWEPVKTFAREGSGRHSKYMTQFYDNLNELTKTWGDIRKYRGTEKGQELQKEYSGQLKYRTQYNKIQRQLSKHRKRIKIIYNDKDLSRAEKRQRIDRIQKQMNRLAERAVEQSRSVF